MLSGLLARSPDCYPFVTGAGQRLTMCVVICMSVHVCMSMYVCICLYMSVCVNIHFSECKQAFLKNELKMKGKFIQAPVFVNGYVFYLFYLALFRKIFYAWDF